MQTVQIQSEQMVCHADHTRIRMYVCAQMVVRTCQRMCFHAHYSKCVSVYRCTCIYVVTPDRPASSPRGSITLVVSRHHLARLRQQLMAVIKSPLVLCQSLCIHVQSANLLPVSQGLPPVKPRLNQINSHVYMIRPYQIVNYPEHGGVDNKDGQ